MAWSDAARKAAAETRRRNKVSLKPSTSYMLAVNKTQKGMRPSQRKKAADFLRASRRPLRGTTNAYRKAPPFGGKGRALSGLLKRR